MATCLGLLSESARKSCTRRCHLGESRRRPFFFTKSSQSVGSLVVGGCEAHHCPLIISVTKALLFPAGRGKSGIGEVSNLRFPCDMIFRVRRVFRSNPPFHFRKKGASSNWRVFKGVQKQLSYQQKGAWLFVGLVFGGDGILPIFIGGLFHKP